MRLRWDLCRGCGLGFRIFAGDVRLRLGFLQGMCASGLDFCRGCALAAGIFAGDVRLRLGFCSGFARGAALALVPGTRPWHSSLRYLRF